MKFHLHFSGFWEDEVKMNSITERLTNLLGEPVASRAIDGEDLVLTFEGYDPRDEHMLSEVKLIAREEELYVLLYDEARKTIRKGYWYDEEADWVVQNRGEEFWASAVEPYLPLGIVDDVLPESSEYLRETGKSVGTGSFMPSMMHAIQVQEGWRGMIGPRTLRIHLGHTKVEREGVLPKVHYLTVCGYAGGGIQEDWTYRVIRHDARTAEVCWGPSFSGFWEGCVRVGSDGIESIAVPELDEGDEDALRVHLHERRKALWLTYAEEEDVFLPGLAAADALGEALFVDRGVDFEVVKLAQQAFWPFSVSW